MKRASLFTPFICLLAASAILWWFLVVSPALASAAREALGVVIFEVLLVVDAVLLGILYWWNRHAGDRQTAGYVALWQPGELHSGEQVSGYSYWLLAVMAVATVLRFYKLNTDIWMDEVFTLDESVRLPLWVIFTGYTGDNQHTLLSLLANITISVFGETPWALRLAATVFGILSIWAVARLAELVFGRRVALISAILLAVSYHHIWFSQNARGYTMLLFATVFSLEMLLRGLNTGRWRYWIAYALAITLGAWAHLTGVFIAVAHAMVLSGVLIIQRRHFACSGWRPIAALALSAWLTLHCYGMALPEIVAFYKQSTQDAAWNVEWTSPLWLVTELLSRFGLEGVAAAAVIGIAIPVGLFCAYVLWRRDALFFLLGLAPGLLTLAIMLALGRNLWPRMFFNEAGYLVISVVVLMLATAAWLWQRVFARQGETLSAQLFTLALPTLLILLSLSTLPRLYQYPKQDYSGARDFVLQQAQPGDRILGLHMAGRVYSIYYAPQWPHVTTAEDIAIDGSYPGTTWVIYTLPGFVHSAMPELAAELESDYEVVKEFPGTLGDGELVVVRSRSK